MRKPVWKVKEKWLAFVLLDEAQRFFRIAARERGLVCRPLDDCLVAHERHLEVFGLRVENCLASLRSFRIAVHIVAVWDPVVIVEAMARRQVLREVAEVPLADACRRVAFGLERAGDRDLVLLEAPGGVWKEDPAPVACHSRAQRDTACQQSGSTRR